MKMYVCIFSSVKRNSLEERKMGCALAFSPSAARQARPLLTFLIRRAIDSELLSDRST